VQNFLIDLGIFYRLQNMAQVIAEVAYKSTHVSGLTSKERHALWLVICEYFARIKREYIDSGRFCDKCVVEYYKRA
jgi:hypothetical protein